MSYFLLLTASTLLLVWQHLLYVAAFAGLLMVLVQLFPLVLFETLNHFTLNLFLLLAPILLCIVGDIWSENGISLFAVIVHYIDKDWILNTKLAICTFKL